MKNNFVFNGELSIVYEGNNNAVYSFKNSLTGEFVFILDPSIKEIYNRVDFYKNVSIKILIDFGDSTLVKSVED